MHRAIPLGVRVLQALVALTVLALAAAMINQQVYGSPPVTVRYSTFTGGFGMLVCLVGAAAVFVAFIPALVPLVLDGVAGLLFLAGGIAWAVGLRGVQDCVDGDAMLQNELLNQGSIRRGEDVGYGVVQPGDDEVALYGRLQGNCRRAQADEVLQFIAFGLALGLVGLGYVQMRRGGSYGGRGAYVA